MSKRTGKMRQLESRNYGTAKPSRERMEESRAKAMKLLASSEMWIVCGETPEEWICSMNGDGASIKAMIEAIHRTFDTTIPCALVAKHTNEEH